MVAHSLTLNIPQSLFDRIKQLADQRSRSVAEETLDLLAGAMPPDSLPEDLAAAVRSLSLLDDDALWRAARSTLALDAAAELESLHLKRQREGLSVAEQATADGLVRQYERAMLIRAQAAAFLIARNHNVAELVATA
jgi:hypothetical protein